MINPKGGQIATPGWLTAILGPFQDLQVAIISGKVISKYEAMLPDLIEGLPSSYLSILELGDERLVLQWPKGVYGWNMAVRRYVLFEVSGFYPDCKSTRSLIWVRCDGEK